MRKQLLNLSSQLISIEKEVTMLMERAIKVNIKAISGAGRLTHTKSVIITKHIRLRPVSQNEVWK